MVRFSKFEILNRSTQKVTNNYQSVKIFKTVCDRRLRGRVLFYTAYMLDFSVKVLFHKKSKLDYQNPL